MTLRPTDPEKRKEQIRQRREWQRRSVKKYQEAVREETLAGERESGLDRSTPIPRSNPERKKRVRGDEVYGPHHRYVATLECLVRFHDDHTCAGEVQSHHVKSVGAGGKDRENCVSLCCAAHNEVHAIGRRTFEDRYGLDLDLEAARLWQDRPEDVR